MVKDGGGAERKEKKLQTPLRKKGHTEKGLRKSKNTEALSCQDFTAQRVKVLILRNCRDCCASKANNC